MSVLLPYNGEQENAQIALLRAVSLQHGDAEFLSQLVEALTEFDLPSSLVDAILAGPQPPVYTIPWIIALNTYLKRGKRLLPRNISQICVLLSNIDIAQAIVAGEHFSRFCSGLIHRMHVSTELAIPIARALSKASRALDTASATDMSDLTPLHAALVYYAFASKRFSTAYILDRQFSRVNPNTPMCKMDIALFHYYGAQIYIAYHDWERAYEFLTIAMTIRLPGEMNIAIEAYKKWTAVGVICRQQTIALPGLVGLELQQQLRIAASVYTKLFALFKSSGTDFKYIESTLAANRQKLIADGNLELAETALREFRQQVDVGQQARVFSTVDVETLYSTGSPTKLSLATSSQKLARDVMKGKFVDAFDVLESTKGVFLRAREIDDKINVQTIAVKQQLEAVIQHNQKLDSSLETFVVDGEYRSQVSKLAEKLRTNVQNTVWSDMPMLKQSPAKRLRGGLDEELDMDEFDSNPAMISDEE